MKGVAQVRVKKTKWIDKEIDNSIKQKWNSNGIKTEKNGGRNKNRNKTDGIETLLTPRNGNIR